MRFSITEQVFTALEIIKKTHIYAELRQGVILVAAFCLRSFLKNRSQSIQNFGTVHEKSTERQFYYQL